MTHDDVPAVNAPIRTIKKLRSQQAPESREVSDQILLTEAVESGRRWWEPYAHTTDVEKAQALVAACEYWHAAFENALDTRDVALAEVDRLTAEREFLLARVAGSASWVGASSDAMVAAAMHGNGDATRYPADIGDFDRCEETYKRAPDHLKPKLMPIFERFVDHGQRRGWLRDDYCAACLGPCRDESGALDEQQAVCDFCGQTEGHSKRCSVTKFGVNPKPPYTAASREEDARP